MLYFVASYVAFVANFIVVFFFTAFYSPKYVIFFSFIDGAERDSPLLEDIHLRLCQLKSLSNVCKSGLIARCLLLKGRFHLPELR